MNTNTFWGKSRSTGVNVGLIVRIGLATLCLIGSVALTWTLLSPHQGAHASPNTPSPTPTGTPLPHLPPGPVHATWYFAEGKVGQGFTEFLTIQNPDRANACNITLQYLLSSSTLNPISLTIQPDTRWTEGVNNCTGHQYFYLAGAIPGTDSLAVAPGTRGTIIPKNLNARAAAWVHSDQPVVVERPTYFNNFSYGNAQNVSGSATVVGAPAPANDWRFAEGYIGGQFQENLVLANFGPTTANATVVLEYDNGSTLTNTYPIRAEGSITLDVKCSSTSTILTAISTRRPQQWVAPM